VTIKPLPNLWMFGFRMNRHRSIISKYCGFHLVTHFPIVGNSTTRILPCNTL
jgi:hypothetical protein